MTCMTIGAVSLDARQLIKPPGSNPLIVKNILNPGTDFAEREDSGVAAQNFTLLRLSSMLASSQSPGFETSNRAKKPSW